MAGPLEGLFVLDFSTLLPGPLATLMLREAGAEVLKVERPGSGEDMRMSKPDWEGESLGFAQLNRGKKSLVLDLKSATAMAVLEPLIARADILVEQFRPGVMDRLGLGYQAITALNPRLIYCSITGYGQSGPKRATAGHDLNYIGDAGLLALSSGPLDQPTVPPGLIADIGGGSYPAVINILMALRQRDQTGKGAHLDIAMCEGAFAFAYWAFAKGAAMRQPLQNGAERLTGGTPRYRLYPTADNRLIAVAALEQKFWDAFCAAIDLEPVLRDDHLKPDETVTAVAKILAARSASQWQPILTRADCCCTIVQNMDEVVDDPHFTARGVFDQQVQSTTGKTLPALPLPLASAFRPRADVPLRAPRLGEHNDDY